MISESLRLFCEYNYVDIVKLKDFLDRNSVKLSDLLLIDDIQFPTIHSQFDSWLFNYRTFLIQVNRYLKLGKDLYTPKYVLLFHGTNAKNIESIENNGLLPTTNKRRNSLQTTNGFVYLTPEYKYAYDFARMTNADEIAVFCVLCKVDDLSIDMDQIKNCRLYKKNMEIKETLADSLWFGHSVRVKGSIPLNQIMRVS